MLLFLVPHAIWWVGGIIVFAGFFWALFIADPELMAPESLRRPLAACRAVLFASLVDAASA